MNILTKIFPPKVPEKEPVTVPSGDAAIPADYVDIARKAGFAGAIAAQRDAAIAVSIAAFRRYLAENGICVYDHDRVRKYLWKVCPRGASPIWVPLSRGPVRDSAFFKIRDWGFKIRDWGESLVTDAYEKPIPLPVLMTLAKIREDFPAAEGYVSDFGTPKDDPFLAVKYEDTFFIIERWDEPGFRM